MAPRSILIVDDDNLFRQVLSEELRQAGYTVREAPDAREALAVLERGDVALAILDYWLPDNATGVELLKEVRLRRPGTPALLFSSHPTAASISDAMDAGFSCREKPADTLDVLALVRSILGEPAGSSP